MTTITQSISSLGDIPTTADPATFDTRADTFLGTSLPTLRTEINTWAGQANTVAGEINTNRIDAQTAQTAAEAARDLSQTYAGDSGNSADASAASAAFKGEWALLTGALAIPASVAHEGGIWTLLASVANVALSEPGVSADWSLIDGSPREARTANTILTGADKGKIIDVTSGTFSQTMLPAATLGPNWFVYYRNSGTGTVTLDPDSAELINGSATLAVRPGDLVQILCSGTAFTAIFIEQQPGWYLIEAKEASNSATIDFTGLSSTYDEYAVEVLNAVPATDNVSLSIRTSTNGGSSYDSGVSDYSYALSGSASNTTTRIEIGNGVGSDTNENGFSGNVRVMQPSAATFCHVTWQGGYITAAGAAFAVAGFGFRAAAADVDSIRFFFDSGNIESGKFKLYGLRKA